MGWTFTGYPSISGQTEHILCNDCIHPPDFNFASESGWKLALPACEIPYRFVPVNFITLASDCQSESPTLLENLLCRLRREPSEPRKARPLIKHVCRATR